MLSLNPLLTYSDVVSKLKATATPFPAGSGCTTATCGAGILNAPAALRSVSALSVSAGSNQTVSGAQPVTLSGSVAYGTVTPTSGINYQWSQISGPTVPLANASTATATFTAPATSATLGFQLKATDLYGNTNSSSVTVNVVSGYPVLTVPGTQTVTAGNTLSFTVAATSGATLSAGSLPAGATFDAGTGQFSWPSATPAGTYMVQFAASNAQGTANGSVAINVQAQLSSNNAPNSGGGGSGGNSSSGGGGGGGCALSPKAPFDPLLPALLAIALLARLRRLRRNNQN